MIKTIFWEELKRYFKLNLLWTLIMAALLVMLLTIFDSLALSGSIDQLLEFIKSFPKEFLLAFNIDPFIFLTVEGYINGEFMQLYLVIQGVFVAWIASRMIGGEITSGTIGFLVTKPVSRVKIFVAKAGALLLHTFLPNVLIAALALIGAAAFTSQGVGTDFVWSIFLLAACYQLFFAALALLIGVVWNAGRALAVSAALLFFAIIFQVIVASASVSDYFQFLNPLYYAQAGDLAAGGQLDFANVFVLLWTSTLFFVLGAIAFRHKDINL